MKRSTFMTVSAAVSLLYGLTGLVATSQLAARYGITLDSQGEVVVKFLAASYVGYAVTNWLARNTDDLTTRSAIVLGNFTGWALSVPVAVYGISVNGAQVFTWMTLAFQILFAAGWGYFAFTSNLRRALTSAVA